MKIITEVQYHFSFMFRVAQSACVLIKTGKIWDEIIKHMNCDLFVKIFVSFSPPIRC